MPNGATGLLLPRRVFLDTGHLIEMSKIVLDDEAHVARQDGGETTARRKLIDGIRHGAVVPVIGEEQPYEWVRRQIQDGYEIAQVLDQAPVCYIASRDALAIAVESAAEAVRVVGLGGPAFPSALHPLSEPDPVIAFMRHRIAVLRTEWERLGMAAFEQACLARGITIGGHRSVRQLVEACNHVRQRQPETDQGLFRAFCVGLWQTQDNMGGEKGNPIREVRARLERMGPLTMLLEELDIRGGLDAVWDRFRLENCPTLDLWSKLWWRYAAHMTQRTPAQNDARDVSFVPAYCYADLSLTEQHMCAQVHAADAKYKTRVFAAAADVVSALGL